MPGVGADDGQAGREERVADACKTMCRSAAENEPSIITETRLQTSPGTTLNVWLPSLLKPPDREQGSLVRRAPGAAYRVLRNRYPRSLAWSGSPWLEGGARSG